MAETMSTENSSGGLGGSDNHNRLHFIKNTQYVPFTRRGNNVPRNQFHRLTSEFPWTFSSHWKSGVMVSSTLSVDRVMG